MIYFAYGSNLNLAQMERRCPGAVQIGPGHLEGWRLDFRGPLDVTRIGGKVPGFIFQLNEDDTRTLDRYEGYPKFYTRVYVMVNMAGRKVQAQTYTMTDSHKERISPPSEGYLRAVTEGYGNCGLWNHIQVLYDALERSKTWNQ